MYYLCRSVFVIVLLTHRNKTSVYLLVYVREAAHLVPQFHHAKQLSSPLSPLGLHLEWFSGLLAGTELS